MFYPNSLDSDYPGQWGSYPRFVLNGNYLDLFSKQSAAPAEMVHDQDSGLEQDKSRVYFYLLALSFKVFLQLASSQESPPPKFAVMVVRLSLSLSLALSFLLWNYLWTPNLLQRGDAPNPPLEHRCNYIEDGKPCQWSFNRRYDRDRHERSHLQGAAPVER